MPVTLTCQGCQKPFQVPPSCIKKGTKYCSQACSYRAHRKQVEHTCTNCGKLFTTVASRVTRTGHFFCSATCWATRGPDVYKVTHKETPCANCGTPFVKYTNAPKKYCSS